MFRRSRRKIVAAILSVLVLILTGTFGIIYLASYVKMTNENRELLEAYVFSYNIQGAIESESQEKREPPEAEHNPLARPPMLELSTFYSAAISPEGEILHVDTADSSRYSEEQLTALAEQVMDEGKQQGVEKNLIYRMEDKGTYTLVAFLDNTVILKNIQVFINYTLIFGAAAFGVLFFLARCLAERIVAPLEKSYQQQKQFISDAGHELKTPVAVMNANLELLEREMGSNPWLSNVQYENQRMADLIKQLLELARAENATFRMETVDISQLVYGEALPFETLAFEKGLRLESSIAEDIFVTGASEQLRQITSVLIDNGLRHSPKDGVVALSLKRKKNFALLSVTNKGEPIPKSQREKIFERFYRADEARTGEAGNYGLGLAIAKAITITHKGKIGVECRDGNVEFWVKIPMQR